MITMLIQIDNENVHENISAPFVPTIGSKLFISTLDEDLCYKVLDIDYNICDHDDHQTYLNVHVEKFIPVS